LLNKFRRLQFEYSDKHHSS